MLKIKLIPAEHGDCIWIRIADDNIFNILIDGGTRKTYLDYIKKEIAQMENTKEKIDLIICTHMDNDHIGGLVQTVSNIQSQKIGSIWYNGFLQVVNSSYYTKPNDKYTEQDYKILDEIIAKGTTYDGKQEIGIKEGLALGTLLTEKKILVNPVTFGKAISTEFVKNPVKITDKVKITVIGPSKEKIKNLETEWCKKMNERGFRFRVSNKLKLMEAFEYQMEAIKLFYKEKGNNITGFEGLEKHIGNLDEADLSVTNKSSITFIIHYGKEKFLFLSDTITDNELLQNLEHIVGHEYRFKAIKLPHHGSRYNITHDFIKRYKADEYYCLTNSRNFGHPDLEVLSALICCDSEFKELFFNYPIEKAFFLNNEMWKEKYNYDITIGTEGDMIERNFKWKE